MVDRSARQEVGVQLALHGLVFWLYAVVRGDGTVRPVEVAFFLQYALAAGVVSYALLPYLYRGAYGYFGAGVVVLLAVVIVSEEVILEPLFFSGSRASMFPGVLYTLTEVLPLIAILAGGKFAYDAIRQQRQLADLRLAVREGELENLRAQINPHFLFNNLNNLYSHAVEQSARTPEIILGLAGALRYMLYESRAERVPLLREVEQLRHLVRLGELQIEERGCVRLRLSGPLGSLRIAPLLLNPFVENAFKYAMASQAEAIEIHISLRVTPPGTLSFTCSNTYAAGYRGDETGSGIGLANVRKRLELIYPAAYTLTVIPGPTHYRVTLQLQLPPTPAAAV